MQIKVILFIKSIQKWMIFLKFTEKKIMVFDFWFWELVLCQDLVQVKKTKYLLLEQTHYTSESPVRYFFMKKLESGVKINNLCIGTENIFISPRLFFQDGRVPRRIFCEERIAIAFVIPGKPLSKKKIQY